MQILKITERPRLLDKVGIHLLISVLSFIGLFFFVFYGGEAEDFNYLLEHKQIALMIALSMVVVGNMILMINSLKKRHVVGLEYTEKSDHLRFELVNRYSKTIKELAYSRSEIYWEEKEETILGIEPKKIVLFKLNSGKSFARIDPSLNPWSWNRPKIKKAMISLEKINLDKQKRSP